VRNVEATRNVASVIDEDGRQQYKLIALRRQLEQVHLYTIVALGAKTYLLARRFNVPPLVEKKIKI